MPSNEGAPTYLIWGGARVASDPLELPALIQQVRAGKVTATTWVFATESQAWVRASAVPELQMFFRRAAAPPTAGATAEPAVRPGVLRRIKLFADMDEGQMDVFVRCMEVAKIRQFSHVVRRGDHGDAMYLVLEGELRALSMIDNKETTLTTMAVGEAFGEVSLLDHGPRSVDVVANADSTLLRISAEALKRLLAESPQVAAAFMTALARSMATRMRQLTKRYEDSIHFARTSGAIH